MRQESPRTSEAERTDQTSDRPPASGRRLMLIALGFATVGLAVNGLGRFAYALLLPSMRADLHWTYAIAGALNTANAAGYLAGALLGAPVAALMGQRRALLTTVTVSSLSVLASALTSNVVALATLRIIGGATGAIAFIVAGALVARASSASSPARAALLLGVCFSGPGMGIALSGVTIPTVLAAGDWRLAWALLGALCLACCVVALLTVRAAGHEGPRRKSADGSRERMPIRPFLFLLIPYGLYGAGYIAYMTFVVALLRSYGAGDSMISAFWLLTGLSAVAGTLFWMPIFGRLRGGVSVALVLGGTAVGALLPLFWQSPAALFGSAILFGSSFLSVITAVTSGARRVLPRQHWSTAIAVLTVSFALGQCAGPVLAGALADQAGGVRIGIELGALIVALAAVLALFHRERESVGSA